jgi:uncharacterized protein (DUF2235 family)
MEHSKKDLTQFIRRCDYRAGIFVILISPRRGLMSKNIIICSDGTGNTAVKNRGTNVFKLFEAIDLNGHRTDATLTPQVALYDDGVGTQSFLPLKLLGGAFGWGLKRNVLKLYTGLVRTYDPGDQIYLFGFSRGAFTVRTVGGLIAKCGILDWNRMPTTDAMRKEVAAAYRVYRQGYRTWLWRMFHLKSFEDVQRSAADAMSKFRTSRKVHDGKIHFVGVWDTVDAVGGPFHISDFINTFVHRFKFPDQKLSKDVEWAVQALSIDDARAAFEPRLWEDNPKVEQAWFSGVHSNVGGGYPKQGMSLVTLDWMMQKACERGLRIVAEDRRRYWEHGSVDDKLYDSRAGLGVFYRWKPRNMLKLWEEQKAGARPKVHLSVFERIAHGTDGYAPGTLAPDMDVVYTPSGNLSEDRTAATRAEEVQCALANAFRKRGVDLEKVRGTLILGRFAYYLYVVSCLAVILAASVPENAGSRLNPWIVLKNAGSLIYDAATGQWAPLFESAKRLFTDPWLLGTLLSGFIISAAIAYRVGQRRSLVFSRFWHESRQELRQALQTARKKMQHVDSSEIEHKLGSSTLPEAPTMPNPQAASAG